MYIYHTSTPAPIATSQRYGSESRSAMKFVRGKMKRGAVLFYLAIILGMLASGKPVGAQSATPKFETVPCDAFDLGKNAPLVVDGTVTCGYLTVPENRQDPAGNTIQLGVMIIKSTSSNPASDPLVLVQGGPGGSGIDLFSVLASPGFEPGALLRADRDLVILEQRGTLHSQPFLNCPEVLETDLAYIEQELDPQEEARLYAGAYRACRERLQGQGVDLQAYNSYENADDVAALAEALGYDQINFYGVSYGSQLGQHLMKRHPGLLRAVILDGVVSLAVNPNQKIPWSISRSLKALFVACREDGSCNQSYPDLETVFFDLVNSLNQSPVVVPLVDKETGESYQAVFTGDDLIWLTAQLLYVTEAIPLLPMMIYDAQEGIYTIPERLLPIIAFDRSFADGMYITVMCAEDFDFTSEELDIAGAFPEVVAYETMSTDLVLEICSDFDVPELGEAADESTASDIPTLLFSGYFDPVTPPQYAQEVVKTLERYYAVEFPSYGHGAFMVDTCSSEIMRQFLRDPLGSPDTSCAGELPAPAFSTPASTLTAPGARYLTNLVGTTLEDALTSDDPLGVLLQGLAPLALPIVLVWLLVLFPLVWCLSWVVNRIQRAPPERRKAARVAPWIAALLAFVTLILVLSQVFAVGVQVFTGGLETIAGMSRSLAWVYVFPLAFACLTIIVLVLAVLAWAKSYWGLPRRLYYSLTALAAVLLSVMMAHAGLLSVLFV